MKEIAALDDLPSCPEAVVVGAGPAGMAAAVRLSDLGVACLLVDEQVRPGGQIYRGMADPVFPDSGLFGPSFAAGGALLSSLQQAEGISYLPRTSVWHLSPDRQLGLSREGQARLLEPKAVILATGAQERPFPIEGWTLPGVMTAGAAQILLKTVGLVPQRRSVLAGCGPLLWLLAAQLLRAGGRLDLLLDTTPSANLRHALPKLPAFLGSPYFREGWRLLKEVRARTRVVQGVTGLRALGDGRITAVAWRSGKGRWQQQEVGSLFLHQGVIPSVNLPAAAGIPLIWNQAQACFHPQAGRWGRTTLEGVYLAGDGCTIEGAQAAEAQGHLAALEAARLLGRLNRQERDGQARPWQGQLAKARRGRTFLDSLYRPARGFRIPPDAALACRCEEVSGLQLRRAIAAGAQGANQVKAFTRCGMGPCQGRLCGSTVVETIAAERGVSPAAIGYYRLRPPVKPLTLAELASLPRTDADVQAVVRP